MFGSFRYWSFIEAAGINLGQKAKKSIGFNADDDDHCLYFIFGRKIAIHLPPYIDQFVRACKTTVAWLDHHCVK